MFENHHRIKSVKDIKAAVEDGFRIVDEYGTFYTWPEFVDRVVLFEKNWPDAQSHMDYPRRSLPK